MAVDQEAAVFARALVMLQIILDNRQEVCSHLSCVVAHGSMSAVRMSLRLSIPPRSGMRTVGSSKGGREGGGRARGGIQRGRGEGEHRKTLG